mgnify:CR=1 FL=1|jgi:hypothetical protein
MNQFESHVDAAEAGGGVLCADIRRADASGEETNSNQ